MIRRTQTQAADRQTQQNQSAAILVRHVVDLASSRQWYGGLRGNGTEWAVKQAMLTIDNAAKGKVLAGIPRCNKILREESRGFVAVRRRQTARCGHSISPDQCAGVDSKERTGQSTRGIFTPTMRFSRTNRAR